MYMILNLNVFENGSKKQNLVLEQINVADFWFGICLEIKPRYFGHACNGKL